MSYSHKAYESSLRAHKKLIATKLLDGIEKLYENKTSERRWIWELLQNAKDVAKERVRIQIVLRQDSVEFQHNGSPFLIDNVTYLIEQVSTKERASELGEALETTGKFGTGFMTTHLLSKKVEVQGVLEDIDTQPSIYKRFALQLDRDASTPEQMIAKVDESYKVFEALDDEALCPQLESYVPHQDLDTSFNYSFNRKGLRIARVGIGDLHNALSYVLIFLPKIETVTVIDKVEGDCTTYAVATEQTIGSGIKLSTIKIEAGAETSLLEIASVANKQQTLTIAVPVKEDNRFSVQPFSAQTPRLFCDFPLVGSEQFSFPVVFNSPLFNPSEPRDTVLLDDLDDEKRQFNKRLFEECLALYEQLLNHASKEWKDIYQLAYSPVPERVDTRWYKSNVQKPIRQKVLDTPIVDTHADSRIPLAQAHIPYHRASGQVIELWKLVVALHADTLPCEEHVLGWYEIIDADWEKDFDVELRYTVTNLVQDIASQQTLAQLAQRLNKSKDKTIAWLNQVIAFVEHDRTTSARKLLNTYPVIPNQYGNFQFLSKLSQDDGIPEEIKYVLKILDEDWKQQLGDLGICCKFPKHLDINKASRAIDDKIRKSRHGALRKAMYYLASCQPTPEALGQPDFAHRTQIWQFAKDLDSAVPELRTLSTWTAHLWTECDAWLLQTLVSDLVAIGNLQSLQANLQQPSEDEAAIWLSDFVSFLKRNAKWKLFYVEEKVLPNQKGQFLKKNSLSYDADIPEEIKDVLEKLDIDYRSELLDKRIQGFESDCRQRDTRDASSEIDLRLVEKDSLEDEQVKSAVFALVSYMSEKENAERKTLWQLASTFYGKPLIDELRVVPNLDAFNWSQCNSWMIKRLSLDAATTESVSLLAQRFSADESSAVEYLSELICFAATQQQNTFTKELKLWPNQHGFFVEKKALKKDGGIDSALKDICGYLAKKDWYACLLFKHNNFLPVEALFDERETEEAEAVAREIDQALKDYIGDRRDHNFVEALRMLFAWKKHQEDSAVEQLLPYFHKNKAQLFLDICEDQSIHGCIFDMLQVEPDKLEALQRLANASDISSTEIDRFVAHRGDLAALAAIRSKQATPESAGDVLDLLSTLGLEPEYLDMLLSEQAAQVSTATVVTHERTTAPRSVRTYPQVISFEETTEEVADVGFQGEEFVYRKLVAKYGSDRVVWMNEEGEDRNPYDFKVLEENLKEVAFYIDAKSSRSGEHSSGSIFFSITNAQWDFLKECDNYYIAKVFRALSEKPNLQLIKIDLRDELV